jgi:lincosamide nucleotidyltransferase A/C/D/E
LCVGDSLHRNSAALDDIMAGVHEMSASDAIRLLDALTVAGVEVCVGGGWAVDALLEKQTRHHSDLDVWVPAEQAHEVFVALGKVGLDRVFPWPDDRPWNFVLHDGARLRTDLHFVEVSALGDYHYGSALGGESIPAEALAGQGRIAGNTVRCESPRWAVRCHTGYDPRPVDRHDVALLCRHFEIELPPAFRGEPGR